ncbi:MAG: hypothetical protein NTW73_00385, partial [Candidatus Parcubacteria bacterium]|nr:hypothetical protein [Candidatus Parcubacteria bacterium]
MKKYISLFLVSVAILGLTIGLAKAVNAETYQGSITSINYNDATFILSSSPIVKVVTNTNTKISFKSGTTTVIKPFSNLKTGMVVTVIGTPSISLSSNPSTIVTASEVKVAGTTTKPLPSIPPVPKPSAGITVTHNECRNSRCYKMPGAGDSQCKVNGDCQNSNSALVNLLQEQVNALVVQLQNLLNQQQQDSIPPPSPSANGQYHLRDTGPAGGIIFYDKGYESDGWRYMEVFQYGKVYGFWGMAPCYGTDIPGADGTATGTGHQNTHDMIAAGCGNVAQKVHGVLINGYSDWFLPSKDELNKIYVNTQSGTDENGVVYTPNHFDYDHMWGNTAIHWSSSEYGSNYAWSQNMASGYQLTGQLTGWGKDYGWQMRAVRAFGSSAGTHLACDSNYQCVTVSGAGSDLCSKTTDCASTSAPTCSGFTASNVY